MNNEQDSLGGGGLQPVAFDNGNLQPASRPADDNGLAEVEIDGEINAKSETQRVDIPGGVTDRTLASSDADTEPDSGLDLDNDEDTLGQAGLKIQARLRDRQPVSAFDSAQKPVQAEVELQPVFPAPIENKELTPACTGQPVQAPADCPPLIAWRQVDGGIWLPRFFTAVSHLKYECHGVSADFQPVTEIKTGWQIQWNTPCTVCGKRFRPVAGFITLLHLERMKELPENEQQEFIADIITKKFKTGSVSGGHSRCFA